MHATIPVQTDVDDKQATSFPHITFFNRHDNSRTLRAYFDKNGLQKVLSDPRGVTVLTTTEQSLFDDMVAIAKKSGIVYLKKLVKK